MNDETATPGPGTLTVTYENGTTQTYTLPDESKFEHKDGSNQVKFRAHPAGETSGVVNDITLNFDKMTGYVTSWVRLP